MRRSFWNSRRVGWVGLWLAFVSVAIASEYTLARVSLRPDSEPAPVRERRFKSIELLRVGDRLVSRNPDTPEIRRAKGTNVDPSTWKKVTMYADLGVVGGQRNDMHIETLQPPTLMRLNNIVVGSPAPIPFDLVEMGLPSELRAMVTKIDPCPPIRDGEGEIVLSTVNYLSPLVREIHVVCDDGTDERIGVTEKHPFYTERGWVAASELREGDNVFCRGGTAARVSGMSPQRSVERVYNLTVENEHTFFVSSHSLLVHNNCFDDALAFMAQNVDDLGNPRGAILVIETGDDCRGGICRTLPDLPNYPANLAGERHALYVLDGQFYDRFNPAGILIDDWLDEFARLNGGPVVNFMVNWRPWLPGTHQMRPPNIFGL